MPRVVSRARAVILGAAALGAGAWWAIGLVGPVGLVNWFYPVRWRGLDPSPPALAIALAVALPLLVFAVLAAARARRHAAVLALLVATSLTAQGASLLAVGPPLGTVIDRFQGGHGAFLAAAHREHARPLDAIRRYRVESEAGTLGPYAPSKPPGTFAFYVALEALSRVGALRAQLHPLAARVARTRTLAPLADAVALAAIAFPLLTALVVLPLVTLGRALSGNVRVGYAAALLWASCPSVLAITHHTDGSLYPLLAVGVCALVAGGAEHNAYRCSFAAGLVLALAIWSSFGLLPVFALAAGAPLTVALRTRRMLGVGAIATRASTHLLALGVGLALGLGALLAFGLFPDPLGAYQTAMLYHWRWKLGYVGGRWGLTGGIEFWAYAGLPLLASFVIACGRALGELGTAHARGLAVAALGVLAVHVAVMLAAGCNEAARLWLFEVPFVALVAAADLVRQPGGTALVAGLTIAQFALALVVRASQAW
jgi:hypothetical protein